MSSRQETIQNAAVEWWSEYIIILYLEINYTLIQANLDKKLEMVIEQVVHEQFGVYALNVYAIRKKKKHFRPV